MAQSVSARYLYSSTKPSNAEVVSSSLTWSTQLFLGEKTGFFWDLAALRKERDRSAEKNYAALAAAWARWSGHSAPGKGLSGAPWESRCLSATCVRVCAYRDLSPLKGTGFMAPCRCTKTNVFILRAAYE